MMETSTKDSGNKIKNLGKGYFSMLMVVNTMVNGNKTISMVMEVGLVIKETNI
jgi:hypothetical protein